MATTNNTILQLDIFLKKSGDYEFSFDCGDSISSFTQIESFNGKHLKTLVDCQIKSYSISKKGLDTSVTIQIDPSFMDKLER